MKANEAPEKIYISPNSEESTYYVSNQYNRLIEYIRKDAFIEKACDAYCKVCGHYPHTVPTHICRNNCDYFSDFKKYMEDKA
jgi:hypothetical protein